MIFELKERDKEFMGDYKVRYKNAKFSNQKIELDGKSFIHCEFQDCLLILSGFVILIYALSLFIFKKRIRQEF
jgi:hypothetical protein